MPVFNLWSVIIIMIFYTQKNIQEKKDLFKPNFGSFVFYRTLPLNFGIIPVTTVF